MALIKKLGIWMDHASAHLMEIIDGAIITSIIASKLTQQEKSSSLSKSEHLLHQQERRSNSEYFKKISDAISLYKEVMLFGPTTAKDELFNHIMADHKFKKIKLEVVQSDYMTENQELAFVRDYFKEGGRSIREN